jgi:hypothetical protein
MEPKLKIIGKSLNESFVRCARCHNIFVWLYADLAEKMGHYVAYCSKCRKAISKGQKSLNEV